MKCVFVGSREHRHHYHRTYSLNVESFAVHKWLCDIHQCIRPIAVLCTK